MKTTLKAVLVLVIFALAGVPSFAQTALTQTTLSSAVNGPSVYNGTSPSISGQIFLASVTGISAPVLPGTPVSVIYVGREAMGVLAVSTTTTSVTVMRGYLGTQAAPHPSGVTVLISNVYSTNSAFGANPVPSGFFSNDPPIGGSCTAANTPTTPWVNVLTGAQWLCSSITSTWVPGWNNPLSASSPGATASVASAAGAILPSGPFFTVTGAAAITGFTIPIGFDATASGLGGCFDVRSANGSTWTWTAAGNIAVAGTGTANKVFTFCWDQNTSKFVPNAVS